MNLDYSFSKTIKLLMDALQNNMFISIIISSILITLLFIINKDRKYTKYINLFINVILTIIILYFYFNDFIKLEFNNPLGNINFYFLNSIVFLIVNTINTFKSNKKINYIFYGLVLINLLYSLYFTYRFDNNTLIVIGNIYPMIKFGNIIYIVYYLLNLVLLTKKT